MAFPGYREQRTCGGGQGIPNCRRNVRFPSNSADPKHLRLWCPFCSCSTVCKPACSALCIACSSNTTIKGKPCWGSVVTSGQRACIVVPPMQGCKDRGE